MGGWAREMAGIGVAHVQRDFHYASLAQAEPTDVAAPSRNAYRGFEILPDKHLLLLHPRAKLLDFGRGHQN